MVSILIKHYKRIELISALGGATELVASEIQTLIGMLLKTPPHGSNAFILLVAIRTAKTCLHPLSRGKPTSLLQIGIVAEIAIVGRTRMRLLIA